MNKSHSSPRLPGALLLLFLALASPAQEAQPPLIVETDVQIPMRDGTKLSANIFRSRGEGRFPAILMRTPYGKPDEKSGDAKRYTVAGYAMVVQDCRGRGKSEGVWNPFRYDVEDGLDTQEWVGQQAWCNGSIGTAGGSYVGWTQWAPAPKESRYLKTMVPIVPFGNAYDLAYTGGAFQLALLMGWGSAVGGISLAPDKLQEAFRHLPLRTFSEQFVQASVLTIDTSGEVQMRNALGFFPAPHNLLPGKWLSNPNRSSTRKSCASR
jgi:predicted acyl esterase